MQKIKKPIDNVWIKITTFLKLLVMSVPWANLAQILHQDQTHFFLFPMKYLKRFNYIILITLLQFSSYEKKLGKLLKIPTFTKKGSVCMVVQIIQIWKWKQNETFQPQEFKQRKHKKKHEILAFKPLLKEIQIHLTFEIKKNTRC